MTRVSAKEYALLIGKSEKTVRKMCVKGLVKARQLGRGTPWQIDVEGSERALNLAFGNSLERELEKRK